MFRPRDKQPARRAGSFATDTAFSAYWAAVPAAAKRQSPIPNPQSLFSSGVTLIEMMIVLFIMALLAVAALRALPGEDQRVREAARMIDLYLGTARNRAMETGRPAGVIFERFANRPEACTVLQQCEVPPSFAGDLMNAVVMVQDWSWRPDGRPYWDDVRNVGGTTLRMNSPTLLYRVLKVRVRENDLPDNLIRYGDLIQLGGQGPYYTIAKDTWTNEQDIKDPHSYPPYTDKDPNMVPGQNTAQWPNLIPPLDFPEDKNGYIQFSAGVDLDNNQDALHPRDNWVDNYCLTLVLNAPMLQGTPWKQFITIPNPSSLEPLNARYCSGPYTFKIFRQPVKTAAAALQLPANTAVDLAYSGVGSGRDGNYFARSSVINNNPNPDMRSVMLVFSPNGTVEGVYYYGANDYGVYTATSPIYLLVGRLDRVPMPGSNEDHYDALPASPVEEQLPNWADLKSQWIAIQPQTGLVSTSEMHPLPRDSSGQWYVDWTRTAFWPYVPGPLTEDPKRDWQTAIEQSRTFARQAQAVGGR
ncbi:MAG: prepilin-type N-terminal cleavage/methylation domain-containing protein [Pirellulales bacterium]|nr:prepilin-type N-terminal cleavage/methylation domain-containing protein [Pirellulales bacterium]